MERLLVAVARYPHDCGAALSWFDTIDVGGPVDQGGSAWAGLLLAPSEPVDAVSLSVFGYGEIDRPVLRLVGLTAAEVEVAAREGGKALWERGGGIRERGIDG
jgi:hypothetical protein